MSGQPFLDLLQWHPRDVDTLRQHYEDDASARRMDAERARIKQAMGG